MSFQKAIFRSEAIIHPRIPQTGKVKIQVNTIFLAIPHLTAERRLVAPTPIIALLAQCVVLTGMPRVGSTGKPRRRDAIKPKFEAISITPAAEALAANP